MFVLPGDADPPEAWRAIPEMPDNVTVCYSSNPEPMELFIKDQLATTVSASMWLGEADDFGIRVLAQGGGDVQPFRIGVVSKAKYEESRRMASLAASASDETIAASLQTSPLARRSKIQAKLKMTVKRGLASGDPSMPKTENAHASWKVPPGDRFTDPSIHSKRARPSIIHRLSQDSSNTLTNAA